MIREDDELVGTSIDEPDDSTIRETYEEYDVGSSTVGMIIGGAGAMPRPLGRGYAPSLSDTLHRR
jgi:hypothetical protein